MDNIAILNENYTSILAGLSAMLETQAVHTALLTEIRDAAVQEPDNTLHEVLMRIAHALEEQSEMLAEALKRN